MYRSILTAFAAAVLLVGAQFAVSSPAQASTGLASYYGNDFAGKPTANGESFNPGAYTAASLSLPFGTMVRVTNRYTGRSVVVRINDRGPYVGGRVIDLSLAAAGAIGMLGSGVAPVDIQIVGSGSGTQVASNVRHHHAGVQLASLSARHRHHATVQVASTFAGTKRIALASVGHRPHHAKVQLAYAKIKHHHSGTTIATGASTNAQGYVGQGADTSN